MKILILKPRAINYRHQGYTNLFAILHRQLFRPGGPTIDPKDLPWWLQPKTEPITDPARLLAEKASSGD